MFVNLVNTDIPFAEYQLTADKVDALRFRILVAEPYLDIYDMLDADDPSAKYQVFLLNRNGRLFSLIIAIDKSAVNWSPLLQLADVTEGDICNLSDEQMIDFISEAFTYEPSKSLVQNIAYHSIADMEAIIPAMIEWVECVVFSRRHKQKEAAPKTSIRHYEDIDSSTKKESFWELTPEEQKEVDRIATIVLKKIFDYEYSPVR